MSTLPMPRLTRPTMSDLFRQGWQINPLLTLFGLASVVTLLIAMVGIVVDPRPADAAPGWIKPMKFALSFIIYTITFLWLMSLVRGPRWLVATIGGVTALLSTLELGIITMQVVRGTYSHFNVLTELDGILYRTMGGAIVVLWLMCLALGVLLLIQRLPDPIMAMGIRLGVLVALVGMAVGFLMLGAKNEQPAALAAGLPSLAGAHTIGEPDGGPGLPFVGWSTTSGDLRVGHFIGMHAMQVLPLLAFVLARRQDARLGGAGHRIALVVIAGLSFLGLVVLLTWQALRGQSVVAPDLLTLGAFGTLVAASLLAVGFVLRRARALPQAQAS
jgi:hypothetical protein